MSAHELPVSGLFAAFAVTAAIAWVAGHRRRGSLTVGGGLLAVQGVLHLVFGTAQDTGPGVGHHPMPGAMQEQAVHQQAMDPAAVAEAATAVAHGHGSSSLAMTSAHLAAALLCALWLARGEAAFFRLARTVGALAFTPLRLLLAVAGPHGLPKQPRPRLRTTRRPAHGVVLAHTLSRRGPPRAPAPRTTAPAPGTLRTV
ncbi:hypothetical protein [Streptomyces hypolithicus]